MHYLFGFSGRIGRTQMWLFIPVTAMWLVACWFAFVFGLNWQECIEDCQSAAFKQSDTGMAAGWFVVFILLLAVYLFAAAAVCTKRLRDRNKSGWWLIPYLAMPLALGVLVHESTVAAGFAMLLFLAGMFEMLLLPGTAESNDFDPA